MADNFGYYQALGVSQDSSQDDIKKAYRRLAKKYHPDVSDDPDCARKFREVNEAYNLLNDSKQRTIYDTNYDGWSKFSEDEAYSNSLDHIILNLINSLNNPNSLMRNYAVEALVKIGMPAFDAVMKASNSSDEVVRRKTCDIMGLMRNSKGIPHLTRLLNDPDRYVRRRAAKALTRIGDKSAVIPLMNALQDSEKKVRYRSAEALGKISDERAVESLLKSINDPSSTVRRKVIIALGEIGDTQAITPITKCLQDKSSHLRSTARKTLSQKFKGKIRPRITSQKKFGNICPECSKPVLPNSNFCPNCGFKLNQSAGFCSNCSSPIASNSNFCTVCGKPVK